MISCQFSIVYNRAVWIYARLDITVPGDLNISRLLLSRTTSIPVVVNGHPFLRENSTNEEMKHFSQLFGVSWYTSLWKLGVPSRRRTILNSRCAQGPTNSDMWAPWTGLSTRGNYSQLQIGMFLSATGKLFPFENVKDANRYVPVWLGHTWSWEAIDLTKSDGLKSRVESLRRFVVMAEHVPIWTARAELKDQVIRHLPTKLK